MTPRDPLRPLKSSSRAALGRQYNRLTVLRFVGKNARQEWLVDCRCSCGVEKVLILQHVMRGETQSCGCALREILVLPTHLRVRKGRKRAPCPGKRESQKRWVASRPDKVAAIAKRHRDRYPEKIKAEKSAYCKANRAKINVKINARFATDLRFRIECILRSRVRKSLRNYKASKSSRFLALLGCTIEFFRDHIAAQFTEGMSWDKVMSGEIHIDHRTPVRAFNLVEPAQQALCFHYSNHRPMWAKENLAKSDLLPSGVRARTIKHPAPRAPAADTPVPVVSR